MQGVPGSPDERAQDVSDFARLVTWLQALDVRDPERGAIRDELLRKLSTVPPRLLASRERLT